MKKKINITIILTFLLLALCLFAVGCGGGTTEKSYEISEENQQIWMDRYDETEIVLTKGDKNKLQWKSEDESVVTVDKGLAIAQSKGKTNIIVSDGKYSDTIAVTVRNSGKKPDFAFDTIEAYIGKEIDVPDEIVYGKITYHKQLNYSITVENEQIVQFANGKITGKQEGSTKATITATYKGLELSKEITISVVNPLTIKFAESEIIIHNLKDNVNGKAVVEVNGYYMGDKLDNKIELTITSGEENITLTGNEVIAKHEGESEVTATISYSGATASASVKVIVLPDYDKTEFVNPQYEEITWKAYEGEIGGKSSADYDIYEYKAASNVGENNEHFFTQRVIENSKGKLLTELYRKGYRYFAFDLYYTSDENIMVGCGAYYQWISVGTFFRNDWLTILSADEGKEPEVINRLEKNRWITMVYDVKALWEIELDKEADFFFFSKECESTHYLCNARWSYNEDMIPSENIVHQQKDGYVQATNDEFDLFVPVETYWTPGHVPAEYGVYNGEVGGRTNTYKYKTFNTSAYHNGLIVASSMNESYDSGINKLLTLGNYFAFDIYPENGNFYTFYMWDQKNIATIEAEKTNLGDFSQWLTVIADGKIMNTLKMNKWQTVVISYGDEMNYDDSAYQSSLMFSANNQDSVVYVDNVRFYKDSSFMPSQYEEEAVRPYLPDSATGEVVRIMDGQFKYAYMYSSKDGSIDNAVRFRTVSENGVAGQFFKDGKRYVKFNFFAESNISSVVIGSKGSSNITEYFAVIPVGTAYDKNSEIIVTDISGINADTVMAGQWYTIYIPVKYTSANVADCDVYLYTEAEDASALMTSYIKSLDFIYDINGLYTRDYFAYSALVNVEFITDGDMGGSWKYTNATSGDLVTDPADKINSQNWGESGIAFENVTKRNDDGAGSFFTNGYKAISCDFYVGENTKSISVRVSGQKEVGTLKDYWIKDIKVDSYFDDPTALYIVDNNGDRALNLLRDTWYTLYIPVEYSTSDIGTYGHVSVQSNGGSKLNPSVMYFKNIKYLAEMPVLPEVKVPDNKITVGTWDQTSSVTFENLLDGTVIYKNTAIADQEGVTGMDFGESGFYFKEYYDNKGTAEFSSYKFIAMKFKLLENVTEFTMRISDTNYVVRHVKVGNAVPDNVYLYNLDLTKPASLELNTEYIIYIPVTASDNWDSFQITGGTKEAPAKMHILNVEYKETKPQ